MRKTVLVFLVPFIASLLSGQAAPAQSGKEPGYLKAAPEDLSWWREARFGMFIHWGPVSLRGTEIGWSRGANAAAARVKGREKFRLKSTTASIGSLIRWSLMPQNGCRLLKTPG